MKRLFLYVTAGAMLATSFSCKKSNKSTPPPAATDSSKTVLIKITLTPVPAQNEGDFDGSIGGLLPSLKDPTWKVNGTVRPDEGTIAFTQDDFQNGVLTLESTTKVNMASLSVGGVTVANYPYTVHIEPTINGKIKDSTTIRVTSTLTRQWTW